MAVLKRTHFCNTEASPKKIDYPELTNKPIRYLKDGKYIDAVVQNVNYDIGISIVAANNPEHYLTCMPGPSSTEWASSENSSYDHVWEDIFYTTVDEIQRGAYKSAWQDTILGGYSAGWGGEMSTCPWQ